MPVIFVRQAQARPCHWLTGHPTLASSIKQGIQNQGTELFIHRPYKK
jgi:hypothetical protein